jgi:hypothetical protein
MVSSAAAGSTYGVAKGATLIMVKITDGCTGDRSRYFLRKLVLGIPAQASGKNLTRPPIPSAPQTSCVNLDIQAVADEFGGRASVFWDVNVREEMIVRDMVVW